MYSDSTTTASKQGRAPDCLGCSRGHQGEWPWPRTHQSSRARAARNHHPCPRQRAACACASGYSGGRLRRPACRPRQRTSMPATASLTAISTLVSMTVGIRQRERRPVSTRTSQWLKRCHQPMHSEDLRSVHATGVFKEGQHTPAQAIRSH